MNRHTTAPKVFPILIALITAFGVVNITSGRSASAKEALRLDQCANLGTTCDTANPGQWVNGNLNASKAHYSEGESVPYRVSMSDLELGTTYAITLEYDSTESGHHAIDYLTSFDRTESTAEPCAGETCGGSTDSLAIPADPHVTSEGVTPVGGSFSLHGGNFVDANTDVVNTGNLCATSTCTVTANPDGYVLNGTFAGSSHTSTTVYFTADSTTAVLAWGGHIATRLDWGMTGSAVSISGSPYHMRLINLGCSTSTNCGVGNSDRSLASEAVVYAAGVTIHKTATPTTETTFAFTASPAPLTSFSLDGTGGATSTKVFAPITEFTTYTIDETDTAGWALDSVTCTVTSPNAGSWNATATGVVLDVREGELYDCTFTNAKIPSRAISLGKQVSPTTYSAAGDQLTYTYTITNSGQATLGPTQFTITDDHIASGAPFDCGPATASIAPAATLTCTATYTVTSGDVEAGSVRNIALAGGAGLKSDPAEATATYSAIVTTTTTTTAPTTTTTTVPGSTTLAPQEVTTTTVTSPPRTIGRPVESTVLVLGGDVTSTTTRSATALPTTGGDSGPGLGVATIAILAGAMVLVTRLRRVR